MHNSTLAALLLLMAPFSPTHATPVQPAPATADALDRWNEKAVAFVVARNVPPPAGGRILTMVQTAVFDALNSITPRYRPFLARLPATGTESADAATAAATAGVLSRLFPDAADAIAADLAATVAALPDGAATAAGLALGDAAAAACVSARTNDGAAAPDRYRPRTPPGVYVPTSPVAVPHWPGLKPFAIASAGAYRPGPPVALDSATWKADLQEIRTLGGRDSKARTSAQTETARFWLTVGPQAYIAVTRQLADTHGLKGVDKARFIALAEVARADSILAVFDAKYHYGFWRPVTAVRATWDEEAGWLPLDTTPPHPEYPCAHCVSAASVAAVAQAEFGSDTVARLSSTSPTAPGVTRSWTSLKAFTQEVSDARIWAGFHYRFSTRVAEDMGRRIGTYVAQTKMQPLDQK
jgi:hypothetical protein